MKIGIYTFNITAGKSGGIQQYSSTLIDALLKYSQNEVFVFTNKKLEEMDYAEFKNYRNYKKIILPFRSRIYRRIFYGNKMTPRPFLAYFADKFHTHKNFRRLFVWLGDPRSIIYGYNIDVLHFPSQIMPYFNWQIPTLISLHDLQHERLPEFFGEKRLAERRYYYAKSAKECSQIIVSFNHAKEDIVEYIKIDPEKISATWFGFLKDFDSFIDKRPELSQEIFKKYGIPSKFIFYPSRTWKHKNHIFLLEALSDYINKYNENIFLVCSGGKSGYYELIDQKIKELGLENSVIFTGFISAEELAVLYKKAFLVVVPTLFEGGSGPLFEAIKYLTPVICSNVTSLPETIGDSRFVFNPNNKNEFCELMHKMLTDEKLRQENIENSQKQLSRFDWKNVIKKFLAAYEKAVNNYRNKEKQKLLSV